MKLAVSNVTTRKNDNFLIIRYSLLEWSMVDADDTRTPIENQQFLLQPSNDSVANYDSTMSSEKSELMLSITYESDWLN